MPIELTQDGRALQASTPLGGDVLVPVSLKGHEGVSRLFHFTVEFVSLNAQVDETALLGQPVSLTIRRPMDEKRYVHGIVRRFSRLGSSNYVTRYRAEIVPKLWLLSLATDCRTFEEKTVLDIVEGILGPAGVSDHRRRVAGAMKPIPYVVQYQETNLQFITRLLEEAGIYYAFEHAVDKHTVVFSDSVAGSIPAGAVDSVQVLPNLMGTRPVDDTVYEFAREYAVHSKSFALADHDLWRTDSTGSANSTKSVSQGERYVFVGDLGPNSSAADATLRIEAEEVGYDIVRGRSACPSFTSGTRVKIAEGTPGGLDEYHLLEVEHDVDAGDPFAAANQNERVLNSFVAIPVAAKFRPPRVTPRPSVHGTQLAKVVGAGGEGAIDVDEHGCVLLQFPWDRGKGKDASSQHRVHVASVWAGKKWGFIQLPRVGQEVLVEYLEGDVNRPIVTGRVYNTANPHPYALADNKTQSGWKSRTHMGGDDNFNELRFEDKKGEEHVYLQAEKDLKTFVKNDEDRKVDHDRTTTIKNHDTRTVTEGNDEHTVKKGYQKVVVSGDQTLIVNKGNRQTTIEKGNDTHKVAMGNMKVDVSMGNISIKAAMGSIAIEAMQKIELKVGQSTITIDNMGVTIKGMNVKSEAVMAAEMKGMMTKVEGTITADVKGLMASVKGDAMLLLKGGITMIN